MANCEWIDVDGSPVRVQRRPGAGSVDVDEIRRLVREIRSDLASTSSSTTADADDQRSRRLTRRVAAE